MGASRYQISSLCLIALAAINVAGVPAWADEGQTGLDEIVVTAMKREQGQQEVAASLSVLQGGMLDAMSVRNSAQLEEVVPNMTSFSDRPSQSFPALRGVGTPIEGLGVDQGVAVYIDGVLVDSAIANLISVLDLERVEVLRGPQGTLYGRNAIGGVINLVSRTPGDEFTARVRAGVGNYRFHEVGLSVEGPLVPGKLSARIGGVYQSNNDAWYRNNASSFTGKKSADNGTADNVTARLVLAYEPAANWQIRLSGDYSNSDSTGPAWKPLDDVNALAKALSLQGIDLPVYSEDSNDVFELAHNLNTRDDSSVYGGSLTVNYQLSDPIELVSVTGVRVSRQRLLEDIDASPYRYLEVASDATAESISQEFRLLYTGEKVDAKVGLFYADTEARNLFSVDVLAELIAAAGASEPAITRRQVETQSLGIFGQWDWFVTDRITLTLGGRWSESDKSASRTEWVFTDLADSATSAGVERCFVLGPGVGPNGQPECLTALDIPGQGVVPLPPTVTEASGKGGWSKFTPKIGASLAVRDDVLLYASFSQGYRDGGIEGVAANFREFDAETLNAYEVGIKSDWLVGRLRVNGAAFYYDYDDLQLELSQLQNNQVFSNVFNAGSAELSGVEIESTWLPADFLQLSLNVGWLDTEITSINSRRSGADAGFVQPGNEFALAPEWTASFVPTLFFQLPGGSLMWRSEFNYTDSYFMDEANGGFADETDAGILTGANIADGVPPEDAVVLPGTLVDSERLDSRLIVNSALVYSSADDRLEASIWARNLFADEYTVNREFNSGLVYTSALYGLPRTYGATVSVRF